MSVSSQLTITLLLYSSDDEKANIYRKHRNTQSETHKTKLDKKIILLRVACCVSLYSAKVFLMENKSTSTPPTNIPPASIAQDIQLPGNPVIFKSDNSSKASLHLPTPNLKVALASFVMLFLVGGVGVGVYLVGQQQQLKSRASNETLPENLSAVVPKNVINQSATPSAKEASSSAQSSSSASLNNLVIPPLDSSISAELSSSASAEVYDFNDDLAANSMDLSIMYAGWGQPKNDQQKKADLNKDGTINGIDYSIFLPFFNKPL
jgi:hypothetical protein